ncbi:uncharacterized protein LOC108045337 [Drosophila rhopaloa]|uniref:Uncharacterized protein LOC108045337 n=1 Tax=Drosophila rhopaloa TaxID=1041015 RepID=A0A6P4EPL6_DRORH|nr:uncharacterized protein LOC108045337 [Drosophila rhopaloa]
MSSAKPSKDQEPQVDLFDYRELQDLEEMFPIDMDVPNQGMSTSWGIVERQLEEGMGELQRIFDRLAPPPSPRRQLKAVLPTNSRRNYNRSNPIFYGSEETPALPVATGTRGEAKRSHIRNPILHPYDSDPETEENRHFAVQVVDKQEALVVPEQQMDAETRLLAIKFFNLMLARLWRRRKAEVCDLHTLVRKYQDHAARTQTELFTRNQMICLEQRRGEQLTGQLMRAISRVRVTMASCAELDKELMELRKRETALHGELASKSLECEYFAEMLDTCRSEMFRELANYREGATELANQQRRAIELEHQNAQLEDELLTIKDQFLLQNDQMSVALGEKQEQLDTAYETLKQCEQELAKLEMKYNEQLRQSQIDMELQNEISELKRNMGVARYLIFYLTACDCGTFQGCVYHVVAGSLDCLAPAFSAPPMSNNLLRIAMATLFLLFAMY